MGTFDKLIFLCIKHTHTHTHTVWHTHTHTHIYIYIYIYHITAYYLSCWLCILLMGLLYIVMLWIQKYAKLLLNSTANKVWLIWWLLDLTHHINWLINIILIIWISSMIHYMFIVIGIDTFSTIWHHLTSIWFVEILLKIYLRVLIHSCVDQIYMAP